MKKETELADKWIKELGELGFSYDEMIEVFRIAKTKLYKQARITEELENYLQTIYEAKENGGIINIKEATVKVLIMANKINKYD